MHKVFLVFSFTFISSVTWGHARLISPTPRNNNAGIKTGPCGGLARSANPTPVQGGQIMTVQWEETINHPGRFIFSLSLGNDSGFQQNILATIVDEQNAGVPLPHRYQTQVQVPNINCNSCTLQMIQSMEENPASPTYYYSCADLIITQTPAVPVPNPQPMPNGEGTLSSQIPGKSNISFGQGCGTIKAAASDMDPKNPWGLLSMLIPLFTWTGLRRYYFSATI